MYFGILDNFGNSFTSFQRCPCLCACRNVQRADALMCVCVACRCGSAGRTYIAIEQTKSGLYPEFPRFWRCQRIKEERELIWSRSD